MRGTALIAAQFGIVLGAFAAARGRTPAGPQKGRGFNMERRLSTASRRLMFALAILAVSTVTRAGLVLGSPGRESRRIQRASTVAS